MPIFGGAPAAYGQATFVRQFATACGRLPNAKFAGNTKGMSRTRHIARSTVTSLRVAFPNFYVPGSTETAPGATATVAAGIEYNGASTQVLWSASASTTIADGGISTLSDEVSVSIPSGAEFFVRCFFQASTGVLGNYGTGNPTGAAPGSDASNGESWRVGSSATDETLNTGVIVNGTDVVGFIYVPILLVASITGSSVLIIGDSRGQGYTDVYTGTSGDKGELSRAVGAQFGYTEVAVPFEKAVDFINSHTQRVSLKTYFSHVICEYGINDIVIGRNPTQVASDQTTIAGYFPAAAVYQTTLPPETTSSDSWATTANQTLQAENTNRVSLNGLIRAGVSGFAGYLEVADIVESARDSGKWIVDGSANYATNDGVHETNTANILIKNNLSLPF